MKADAWMPLYIAAYLRKTMHLTRDQHGGYMLLIMACWDRGGRLPNDPGQLAGVVKASPAEWRKLAPVLLPFFEIDGEFLVQPRVLSEHMRAAELSETRRLAGLNGGRPKKQTITKQESNEKPIGFSDQNQNGSQTETPACVARPSPSPSETNVSSIGTPDGVRSTALPISKPNGFARFYEAYPKKVKRRGAEQVFPAALKRAGSLEAILAGLERAKRSRQWAEGFVPEPARWLRNDCWLDEPDADPTDAPLAVVDEDFTARQLARLQAIQ